MIVHEARPVRSRPGATQATANACVAASIADAQADIAGWRDASARTAQLRLISEPGGLRHAGTSLELARDASRRLFSRIATFDVLELGDQGSRVSDGASILRPGGRTMSKSTRNSGKSWTPADSAQLRSLANLNTPTRVIGLKLGRTPAAVQTQASKEGVSLKPTNQAPYSRRGR